MFAMTSTTLCSRVAAPAKLNKRAERKTVARAAMTTADAASRRETLGLMAVRFSDFAIHASVTRVVLVGWIDRFGESRPVVSGWDSLPETWVANVFGMDDRARIAHRDVDVFPFAPSHRMERISTHIPIAGDAHTRPRASRGWRLNFQGVLSSRGSRIDHPSTRNPSRHRLRATLPRQKKPRVTSTSERTDFKSASSRTLQAGAALTITRPANAAYGDSANVFGSVSNPTGAFPKDDAMRCETTRV